MHTYINICTYLYSYVYKYSHICIRKYVCIQICGLSYTRSHTLESCALKYTKGLHYTFVYTRALRDNSGSLRQGRGCACNLKVGILVTSRGWKEEKLE